MTSPIAPARANLLDLGLSEAQKDALWRRAKSKAFLKSQGVSASVMEREIFEMRRALVEFDQLCGQTVSEDALRLHRTYGANP